MAFGEGIGHGRAILVEAIATFLLVLTIFAPAVDTRAPAGWAGLMIGLSVTCVVLVFGPLTGAAVNPARAFGPFAGAALVGGDVPWSQLPAYVIGSLLGGLAAALSYDAIARPRDVADPPDEPQGAAGDVKGPSHLTRPAVSTGDLPPHGPRGTSSSRSLRVPKILRSDSSIGTSLMLASRRRM